MILLLVVIAFFIWLIITAFTLEDPALTMHESPDDNVGDAEETKLNENAKSKSKKNHQIETQAKITLVNYDDKDLYKKYRIFVVIALSITIVTIYSKLFST